ncbi:hypothetical protein NUW54_g1340 [Trametes sanguinea]|uniref:Uncharacterized protein n=1 Tax=Trametes sanguinea TaxID=158606 RepID=A0ACC1Q8I5_9APHY|nr:hypothetical protein NUW54_g1340 [Trametes sanguinea]
MVDTPCHTQIGRRAQSVPVSPPAAAEKLTLTVGADESCVLIDEEDGSIVAVILRGASGTDVDGSLAFLEWATTRVHHGSPLGIFCATPTQDPHDLHPQTPGLRGSAV